VTVGVIAMSLNIVFSLSFSRLFQYWGLLPLGGLALANSLATALEMAALLVLMRSRLKGIQGGDLLQAFWQSLASGLAMAAAVWLWLRFSPWHAAWMLVGVGFITGGLIYGGALFALRVREIHQGWSWLSSRLIHR
jgi:putative peptidoglycan lipid II flippase